MTSQTNSTQYLRRNNNNSPRTLPKSSIEKTFFNSLYEASLTLIQKQAKASQKNKTTVNYLINMDSKILIKILANLYQ